MRLSGRLLYRKLTTRLSEWCDKTLGGARYPHFLTNVAALLIVHAKCRGLVQGDMVGPVASDFILWIVARRVMDVPFPGDVTGMDCDDRAANATGFRAPAHAITNLQRSWHIDASGSFAVRPMLLLLSVIASSAPRPDWSKSLPKRAAAECLVASPTLRMQLVSTTRREISIGRSYRGRHGVNGIVMIDGAASTAALTDLRGSNRTKV